MPDAIIGWTGFIGQTLTLANPDADLYNSSNIYDISGKHYTTVYMAGMPAEKWRINRDPGPDRDTLDQFKDILSTIRADQFILISTVDVMDCTVEQTENGITYASHPYGLHRRLLEEFVMTTFPTCYILRLPGLFGKGLKKNAIYDLIHDNQISNISLAARFQWYNTDHLSDDISWCVSNNSRMSHLVSEPISMLDIVGRFFPEKQSSCTGTSAVSYLLSTTHRSSEYWSSKYETLDDMEKYIQYENKIQNFPATISISNIAWEETQRHDVYKILARYRINRIELAPTKISPWDEWTDEIVQLLLHRPFTYPSCQSILFNKAIEIFKQPTEFIDHYTYVASLCRKLGVKTIVFGSPKARHRYETTDAMAINLFRQIGEISQSHGLVCCIEPNASQYGCTWLTNLTDVVAFVKQVDHSNIQINYDLGNYLMESDTCSINASTIPLIGNTQISYRYLQPLTKMLPDEKAIYKRQIENLMALGYSKNISLEIGQYSYTDFLQSVDHFMEFIFG
jgi:sugar phosphate isomerase/epimerase